MNSTSLQLKSETSLTQMALHPALQEPTMNAVNFLNEIVEQYPDAISFAPGAPHQSFFDDLDVSIFIERYLNYLQKEQGLTLGQARSKLYQYGPSGGIINQLVADALKKDEEIVATSEEIVITSGCQEGLFLTLRTLFANKSEVLAVVNPCFVGITGAARMLDIDVVPVNEDECGLDVGKVALACQTARANGKPIKALYLAPDFSNPSGNVLSMSARQELLLLAQQYDFYLLEDNAYGFTASDTMNLPSLKALDLHDRVIYFGSCSKSCLPGTRVGFVVASQRVTDDQGNISLLSDAIGVFKGMTSINTAPISQAIIGGMLLENDCSFYQVAADKITLYQRNLRLLIAALNKYCGNGTQLESIVQWNEPQGGFFVRLRLPVNVDNQLLQISAEKYGVLWTPMSYFDCDGQFSNEIRLSCSYLNPLEIDSGIKNIAMLISDVCVS